MRKAGRELNSPLRDGSSNEDDLMCCDCKGCGPGVMDGRLSVSRARSVTIRLAQSSRLVLRQDGVGCSKSEGNGLGAVGKAQRRT